MEITNRLNFNLNGCANHLEIRHTFHTSALRSNIRVINEHTKYKFKLSTVCASNEPVAQNT